MDMLNALEEFEGEITKEANYGYYQPQQQSGGSGMGMGVVGAGAGGLAGYQLAKRGLIGGAAPKPGIIRTGLKAGGKALGLGALAGAGYIMGRPAVQNAMNYVGGQAGRVGTAFHKGGVQGGVKSLQRVGKAALKFFR